MNFYEHTLVARQNLSQKDVDAIEKKYQDLINNNSGKVIKIDELKNIQIEKMELERLLKDVKIKERELMKKRGEQGWYDYILEIFGF